VINNLFGCDSISGQAISPQNAPLPYSIEFKQSSDWLITGNYFARGDRKIWFF